ncbi:PIG-L family deacetylase [Paenibacillus sp. FSL K6-1096]|uniref:PIG-L deacetylase family protein n=1 Tax=Paenibacillus sp. FSL K6-1096 TaxID=2921460 RepID=UPI0030ECB6A3
MSECSVIDTVIKGLGKRLNGIGKIIKAAKVLVLSPHHDDEVIGCGGTLLTYLDDDTEIVIVYMTDGRFGIKPEDAWIRKEEAQKVWDKYDRVKQIFLDFEDTKLTENSLEARGILTDLLNDFKPDMIFTPWILDLHVDHRSTSIILRESLCQAELSNCTVSSYEVMCPAYSNHSVNITKKMEAKMSFLELYKSQHTYLNIKNTTLSLNEFRGHLFRLKSITYAEGFCVLEQDNYCEFIDKLSNVQ